MDYKQTSTTTITLIRDQNTDLSDSSLAVLENEKLADGPLAQTKSNNWSFSRPLNCCKSGTTKINHSSNNEIESDWRKAKIDIKLSSFWDLISFSYLRIPKTLFKSVFSSTGSIELVCIAIHSGHPALSHAPCVAKTYEITFFKLLSYLIGE